MNPRKEIKIFRIRVILSLLFIIPLGFATKFYCGPDAWWFNDYAGGMLYEIFWCLMLALVWPRTSEFRIALLVLGITSLLEFLQLWHPYFLEVVRSTFIGRSLIGISFTWLDFPYYVIGCSLGVIWTKRLKKI